MSSSVKTKTTTTQKTDADGKVQTIIRKEIITTVDGVESTEIKEEVIEGATGVFDEQPEPEPHSHRGFFDRPWRHTPLNLTSFSSSAPEKGKGNLQTITQLRNEALKTHNEYRARHGVEPLKASKDLNKYAQDWAEEIVSSGQFMHRPDVSYGENIYFGYRSNASYITGKDVVDTWYNEIQNYDYANPVFAANTGHFTQVIWKDSKTVGFGYVRTAEGKVYVVANYDPAGNVQGRFQDNVLPVSQPAE